MQDARKTFIRSTLIRRLPCWRVGVIFLFLTLISLSGCSKQPAAEGYRLLRQGDIELLSALAPVILADGYPGQLGAQAETRLMQALDNLIGTLQEYSRSQLMLLLDVLQVAPIRSVMGAQWRSWTAASEEDIASKKYQTPNLPNFILILKTIKFYICAACPPSTSMEVPLT